MGIVVVFGLLVYEQLGRDRPARRQHTRTVTPPDTETQPRVRTEDLQRWIHRDEEHRHLDSWSVESRQPDTATGAQLEPLPSSRWRSLPSALRRGLRGINVDTGFPTSDRPHLELPVLNSGSVNLLDGKGKWTLLNFWASWCIPCRREMPSLEALADRLPDDSFRLVAVNLEEDTETVREFQKRHDLSMTISLDHNGRAATWFQVHSIPVSWIIDPQGRIMGRIRGPRHWDRPPVSSVFSDLVQHTVN